MGAEVARPGSKGRGKVRTSMDLPSSRRLPFAARKVCNQVLDDVGPGEMILIGYSLGSRGGRRPAFKAQALNQHVRLLVNVGSPLGAGSWDRTWNGLKPFPYDRLDAGSTSTTPAIRSRCGWASSGVAVR